MIVGADASDVVTTSLLKTATVALRSKPAFYGRYFKAPSNTSSIQYQPARENQTFHDQGLALLCIGRQTNRVSGSHADGVADGVHNLSAVIAALGADYVSSLNFDPAIFLDVEPNPTLSDDYYQGWADALQNQGPIVDGKRLKFSPGIYINRGDTEGWSALGAAIANGAACIGAWVANYGKRTGAEGPPEWDLTSVTPNIRPPCRIIGWQYAGDYEDVLDFSLLSPTDGAEILGLMPLPPAMAGTAVAPPPAAPQPVPLAPQPAPAAGAAILAATTKNALTGKGWELHIERHAEQARADRKRTVGTYTVYHDGEAQPRLSGTSVETKGPGDNSRPGNGRRIVAGTYPLGTQDGLHYLTWGYVTSTDPDEHPKPGIEVLNTQNRVGILIHPGFGFLASVGCINLTAPLANGKQDIPFVDSRDRIIAVIEDMKTFLGPAFPRTNGKTIANTSVVIEGEPTM
jgi:hypothetical protein